MEINNKTKKPIHKLYFENLEELGNQNINIQKMTNKLIDLGEEAWLINNEIIPRGRDRGQLEIFED